MALLTPYAHPGRRTPGNRQPTVPPMMPTLVSSHTRTAATIPAPVTTGGRRRPAPWSLQDPGRFRVAAGDEHASVLRTGAVAVALQRCSFVCLLAVRWRPGGSGCLGAGGEAPVWVLGVVKKGV